MKKVTFNENQNQKYILCTWLFAYQSARQSLWEQEALDRIRFKKRVESSAMYLNPVLNVEHRNKVYKKLNLGL